ncbi:hypothetical protein nbrc107696_14800 [Gordonia spumicola]|uniref:Glycoside hydrolase family 5 domain-containing protein n=1 Tax=Gordonia spumicola TaxID=589161 RepID=A0A7I9V732_9ACTN|nr:cellulase family glycosylhydrolase [Gordonia spumicola]GEE01034.1 hypothetical protein nbrc107696_14800 [Gordonia spumicola]
MVGRTLLGALAVTASLIATCLPVAVSPARADTGWTMPRLTVAHRDVTDVTGRTVLLRGVNLNHLAEYAQNDQPLPTVVPASEADFAAMAGLGFNVVRLNLSWSRLEPTRGAFDQAYVDRIKQSVAWGKAHGIYTVLDMHQDAWGPTIGTPSGVACPSPMKAGIGWDGAPGWATITDGWSLCTIAGQREAAPGVARAFQNFYDDRNGIQDRLVRTWARLAAVFKNEPAVAGYDLINEPNPGLREPLSAAAQIGRYYQRAIRAIRVAERGGFEHLAIVEPSALWSAFGVDALPPVRDPRLVFSPHLYSGSINVSNDVPTVEQGFAIARAAADSYNAPLWTGEWGWWTDPSRRPSDVARWMRAADEYRVGGAWWSWTQACGDPHAVKDGNTHEDQPHLNVTRCPSGRVSGLDTPVGRVLAQAYPRAVPGRLTSTSAHGFAGVGTGRVEAWIPGSARPTVTSTGLSDVALTRVDGGWRLTARSAGRYSASF